MIEKIIKDIDVSLENGAYLGALALALTLPDICGKAKYPSLNVGERYKKWYNEHVDAILKPWWIVYTANPNVEKNKNTIKELGLPCDAINDYPDDPVFDKFREQQVTYSRTKLYYNLLLDDKTMGLCLGLEALELLAARRKNGDYNLQLGEYKEEKE
jgi:hypothetical protein